MNISYSGWLLSPQNVYIWFLCALKTQVSWNEFSIDHLSRLGSNPWTRQQMGNKQIHAYQGLGVLPFRKEMQWRLKISAILKWVSTFWKKKCQRTLGAGGTSRKKQEWRGGKGTKASLAPTLSQASGHILPFLISVLITEPTRWLWSSWLYHWEKDQRDYISYPRSPS